jgi:NAD(P)-dependent dehydrogenase (short-subunit alcohol dehydrogenase family)
MPDRKRFTGRSALVTGASSGIGRAIARALGSEGARVAVAGRRRDRLEETAAAIRGAGGEALILEGEVRDDAACRSLVEGTVAAFGGLDHLVNAAGILESGGLEQIDGEDWDRQIDINLRAPFVLTRAAAPELAKRRGSVLNISSVAGLRPYAGLLAYCVSKAGVDMLTRCVALDLAPKGVRVNAVNPGVVVTELHTVGQAVPDYPAFLERSKTTHPLGRVGQPEEVAALALFLLSEESSWITGATYSIDGGRALLSAR